MTQHVQVERREEWIQSQLDEGIRVLIVNPTLLETGLDLNTFTTLIYYNISYNLFTLRQSSRRSWRINQYAPRIEVYFFYYIGSIQHRAIELMATKLSAQHWAAMMTWRHSLPGNWHRESASMWKTSQPCFIKWPFSKKMNRQTNQLYWTVRRSPESRCHPLYSLPASSATHCLYQMKEAYSVTRSLRPRHPEKNVETINGPNHLRSFRCLNCSANLHRRYHVCIFALFEAKRSPHSRNCSPRSQGTT